MKKKNIATIRKQNFSKIIYRLGGRHLITKTMQHTEPANPDGSQYNCWYNLETLIQFTMSKEKKTYILFLTLKVIL